MLQVSEETKSVEAEESDLDEEANLRLFYATAERQKLKRKKIEMQNEDGWVHLQHLALVVCHKYFRNLTVADCINRLAKEEGMEGDAKRAITYQVRCFG